MKKSLSNLCEEEFEEIKNYWISIYPIIYYKLRRFKKIDFNSSDNNINMIYKYFSKKIINDEVFDIFVKGFSFIDYKTITKEFLIELSKTFFVFDYNTRENINNIRMKFLVKAYKEPRTTENLYWSHDGWWNCYYGEIEDRSAREYIKKKYEENRKSKNKDLSFVKTCLIYMYRLSECGDIKEARKVAKFVKPRIYNITRTESIKKLGHFNYNNFLRYNINVEMFLYRTEKSKFKKLLILKRLNRRNSFNHVFYLFNLLRLRGVKSSIDINNIGIHDRPQHITKKIELKVDLYKLTKDEKLIEEIHYLFVSFIKTIIRGYYDKRGIINYFMITEFYFVLFYFLENVYKIDIQEY